jgi:multiple sugar transport system permease protein
MQTGARSTTPPAWRASAAARPRALRLRVHPAYLILVPAAAVVLLPLVYMYSQAITPEADTLRWPVKYVPDRPTLDNFRALLSYPDLHVGRWFLNSLFVASAVTVLVLALDSLAAYGFARLVFLGLLATLAIPHQVTLIPLFLLMRDLGWLDTYHALIWPLGANVFGVFLLRQFFQSVPVELEEAARIDGCSKLRVYWSIILPLSSSALIALAIFTFLNVWNDLFWPLIALNDPEMRTLTVGLAVLQNSESYTQRGLIMAAAALTSTPVLILYAVFQRRIIQGVMISGLGGR